MISWLILALAVAVAAQSTSDDSFMGWYILQDKTERWRASSIWSTSGTVAGDCTPSGSCVLPTGCTSDTLLYANGESRTCNSGFQCATLSIFETVPFGAPSATNWDCRPTEWWSDATLYKNLPAAATMETTAYVTVNSEATTPPGVPAPTPSSSTSNSPQVDSNDGGSKAWIAGAVVGPIAGLGLCAAAYWTWVRHRNQNRHPTIEPKAHSQIGHTHKVEPQTELFGEQAAAPLMLDGDSGRKTYELDSARKRPELP